MANSEVYQSKFLIRIPEDHPDYTRRVQEILEFTRPHGLKRIEVLWPVGLPVLSQPQPEFVVRKRWDLGTLSEAFKKKARARLMAIFEDEYGAQQALDALNGSTPSASPRKPAMPVPMQKKPNVKPGKGHEIMRGREVPEAALSTPVSDPLWAKTLLNPDPDWQGYALRNIAVLDSGCDATHSTFAGYGRPGGPGRVHCFGGAEDYGGHGSFVCGQLIGRGGAAGLPLNHGLLPKSYLWMGNVAVPDSTDFAYPIDLGAYDLALNLLTMKGTPEYKIAGLHKFNIQVLNLSLGGPQYCEIEDESIAAVHDAGIAVVACVHNKPVSLAKWSAPVWFPAALSNAVSVSAIDSARTVWNRSRTEAVEGYDRARLPFVDISAPGVSILSSMPGDDSAWKEGTSFAAPLVTAALAVLRAANPKLSPSEATSLLLQSVHQDSKGIGTGFGCGILHCAGIRMRTRFTLDDRLGNGGSSQTSSQGKSPKQ